MLIIWGKRIKRVNMGRGDLFCPVCRALGRHVLVEVRRCAHIYFINVDAGRVLFSEAVCEGCGLATPGEALLEADRRRGERPIDPPEAPDVLARRLELEERLLDGRIDGQERAWLIAEPIASLEHSARNTVRGPGESVNALIGLGAIASIFAAVIVVFDQGWSGLGIGLSAGAAAFLSLWVWHTARMNGSARRRRDAARVAASLEILQPTEEELRGILGELAVKGFTVAERLRPGDITREIERRARTTPAKRELAMR